MPVSNVVTLTESVKWRPPSRVAPAVSGRGPNRGMAYIFQRFTRLAAVIRDPSTRLEIEVQPDSVSRCSAAALKRQPVSPTFVRNAYLSEGGPMHGTNIRKWLARTVVGAGAIVTMWATTGTWDKEESVALIGLIVAAITSILVPPDPAS
jgi:hypothetical protein